MAAVQECRRQKILRLADCESVLPIARSQHLGSHLGLKSGCTPSRRRWPEPKCFQHSLVSCGSQFFRRIGMLNALLKEQFKHKCVAPE